MAPEPRPRIRAVLFDKDGTLVDFRASWIPACERAAREVAASVNASPEMVARLLALAGVDPATGQCDPGGLIACGTTRELADAWALALNGSDASTIDRRLETIFDEDVRAAPVAVHGVADTLARLHARGLSIGCATMDTEAGARDTLARLGIGHLFHFVCGCDSGFGEKPGAGMVEAFCAHVAFAAHEVAVVGDTLHDVGMGRNAGAALVIGVVSGAGSRDTLAPHCDHVVDSVADLKL